MVLCVHVILEIKPFIVEATFVLRNIQNWDVLIQLIASQAFYESMSG